MNGWASIRDSIPLEMTSSGQDSPWATLALAAIMAVIATAASLGAVYYMQQAAGRDFEAARRLVGGDPEKGLTAMKRYGCAACHTIPGLAGARGMVGPTLAGFSTRPLMPDGMQKTPELVIQWIVNPIGVDPKATMPAVGVTETDARDIATYLFALK